MAHCDGRQATKLGKLLQKPDLLSIRGLCKALDKEPQKGDSLGAILGSNGLISNSDLVKSLSRQGLLSLISLVCVLILVPVTAWSDTGYGYNTSSDVGTYNMPSADHPPIYEGSPISVPVKALVERLAFGITGDSDKAKSFRYDIDTLGQGMAVRLRFKF